MSVGVCLSSSVRARDAPAQGEAGVLDRFGEHGALVLALHEAQQPLEIAPGLFHGRQRAPDQQRIDPARPGFPQARPQGVRVMVQLADFLADELANFGAMLAQVPGRRVRGQGSRAIRNPAGNGAQRRACTRASPA